MWLTNTGKAEVREKRQPCTVQTHERNTQYSIRIVSMHNPPVLIPIVHKLYTAPLHPTSHETAHQHARARNFSTNIINSLNGKRSAEEYYRLEPIAKFTVRQIIYRSAFHWICYGYAKRYNQWWISVGRRLLVPSSKDESRFKRSLWRSAT